MRKSLIGATCACLAVVTFSADATLVSRLGGLAYYDDVADLTWLADANAEWLMNWVDAKAWAADLVVDGNDTWRLPSALINDGSSVTYCYGVDCDSEMGSLYYGALGNVSRGFSNAGPFTNVQGYGYWTNTESANILSSAFTFNMRDGIQDTTNKGLNYYAWAVQSGDVGAVPVPAAVWLFGSGLIGLIGVARRKA